jgi:23S rRNA (cytidine1920-2'-O)/16S rRNA (cytidine1409-2'-O)-methyltransferase
MTPAEPGEKLPYVSRGGLKLAHALDTFAINPKGWTCADLGCSTGGFTDCLLQRGAARIVSVDTGYGVLAYKLRVDPRIKVLERTNAMHAEPFEPVDLVVMDVSWTPMRHALPAALKWLKPTAGQVGGGLIALVKPHYERSSRNKHARGILTEGEAAAITDEVIADLCATHPVRLRGKTQSPLRGGGGKHKEGNPEWLIWLGL